jgi:hypothetical protein
VAVTGWLPEVFRLARQAPAIVRVRFVLTLALWALWGVCATLMICKASRPLVFGLVGAWIAVRLVELGMRWLQHR